MKGRLRQAALFAWSQADSFVRYRFLAAVLLVFAASLLAAAGPVALKFAVDGLAAASVEDGTAANEDLLFSIGAAAGPAAFVLAYVACLWGARSLSEARGQVYGAAEQRLHRALTRRLLRHIIDLPMAFHLDRQTGALNQTLVQGLAGYRILMSHLAFTAAPALFETAMVGCVLIFLFEPVFAVIAASAAAGYLCVSVLGAARIIAPVRALSARQVAAYAIMADTLAHAETVKCSGAEAAAGVRCDRALADAEQGWFAFYRRKCESGLAAALVFALALAAAMTLAAARVRGGALSVGDFVLINAYMLQILRPLESLGAAFRDMAQGAGFIERMMVIAAEPVEACRNSQAGNAVDGSLRNNTGDSAVTAAAAQESRAAEVRPGRRDHEGDHSAATASGGGKRRGGPSLLARSGPGGRRKPGVRLEARALAFSYPDGRAALRGVDFTIEPGRTLAVVGESGAGKSSLVRLLLRYYEPASGEILLDGAPLREYCPRACRRMIAVVPQETAILDDTIAFNIAIGGGGGVAQADIERAARLARLHERICDMPEGYGTRVGERGLKLSGGERQRIAIARAVLKDPAVFIFDEATAALDPETASAVLASLREVSAGVSTLMISHRLASVIHADEVIVMARGSVIERGTHGALLAENRAYAAMWRAQGGD